MRGLGCHVGGTTGRCGKSAWRLHPRAYGPRQFSRWRSTCVISAVCSARRRISSTGSAEYSDSTSRRDILRHRSEYRAHARRSDSAVEREQGSAPDSHRVQRERDGLRLALSPVGESPQKPPRWGGGQQEQRGALLLVPSAGVAPAPRFDRGPTTGATSPTRRRQSRLNVWFCAATA